MADIRVAGATPTKKAPEKPKSIAPEVTKRDERIDSVDGIFQIGALGCIMFGQFADAGAIDMHGHNISTEIVNLADTNERIAKTVDLLSEVGPYAALFAATMPLIIQCLVNHKILSAEKIPNASVMKPETLEAHTKTQMMRQAMEAIKAQKEAQEELASLEAEMMAAQNGEPDHK